jgi:hypothetical protein
MDLDHTDSAKHVDIIESLRSADLSAEHEELDVYLAGPGYLVVTLAVNHGPPEQDAGDAVTAVRDLHAWKDHISEMLNGRWGDQHLPWPMLTLTVRAGRGEEIPEPWAVMSTLVDELRPWQPPGTERWIGLGVADREDGVSRLLVVASDVYPA